MMNFTVAIRTQCFGVLRRVLAAIGEPNRMMHLQKRRIITPSRERGILTTSLADTIGALQNLNDNVRVASKHFGEDLDRLGKRRCLSKPGSSLKIRQRPRSSYVARKLPV